jgi:hypothetical protein
MLFFVLEMKKELSRIQIVPARLVRMAGLFPCPGRRVGMIFFPAFAAARAPHRWQREMPWPCSASTFLSFAGYQRAASEGGATELAVVELPNTESQSLKAVVCKAWATKTIV